MKHLKLCLPVLFLFLAAGMLDAQKNGLMTIGTTDLEAHMKFLASDELEGRNTGEQGLQVAATYLASQARLIGLTPADSAPEYKQYFYLEERSVDRGRSRIVVSDSDSSGVLIPEPFYMFPMPVENEISIEGEVVFAGYGIHDEENRYDDFDSLDVNDKVVMLMTRAPMNEDGSSMLFDDEKWNSRMSFQYKLPYLMSLGPKAILIVYDPKSGHSSIDDDITGLGAYLTKSLSLKGSPQGGMGMLAGRSKIIFIHRSVADRLLEGTGNSLLSLQEQIDAEKEPGSFLIPGKKFSLRLSITEKDVQLCNVFGFIEGSDPALKDEMVIYMAHYDHVGMDEDGGVFNGADDNASGSVALLEIAEAFMEEKKAPARSVGFLWVAAEEVGLYGSGYYAGHPLFPLSRTAAAINLDMIGRTRTPEDDASDREGLTIQGGDTIKVIGGLQSKVLMEINEQTLSRMGLVGNYIYNDREHPDRYFYRSDHINFARKDVPVLFYSTGTHNDYHRTGDTEDRIDYVKFLKMTKFSYVVGWNVANYKEEITVDSPMSAW